ncbi:hypothetical protein TVAG_167060 [Trichomonas vaginalis G3]|uniref:Uncharacterized protein n=1 Tax=Trichomonas vaginalis (strain ATCC PRA-98 / G3) TaxID=412133 RepID=A2DEB3_TRIV3|nr:hypothetical protein TVAGG3_0175600 [Trichomonas vaginalis G3]EAY21331.1 hypothetical protein TVAG_167060 [Trichomonas vaginalis G3]KAI5548932.1 hypothetical protein TVAGG3_0175600 [Trichomonas vaginalis G3]|eukprot:XP_001582317.1 hypothetical protein [Trichomonas vaginalis G3]
MELPSGNKRRSHSVTRSGEASKRKAARALVINDCISSNNMIENIYKPITEKEVTNKETDPLNNPPDVHYPRGIDELCPSKMTEEYALSHQGLPFIFFLYQLYLHDSEQDLLDLCNQNLLEFGMMLACKFPSPCNASTVFALVNKELKNIGAFMAEYCQVNAEPFIYDSAIYLAPDFEHKVTNYHLLNCGANALFYAICMDEPSFKDEQKLLLLHRQIT